MLKHIQLNSKINLKHETYSTKTILNIMWKRGERAFEKQQGKESNEESYQNTVRITKIGKRGNSHRRVTKLCKFLLKYFV